MHRTLLCLTLVVAAQAFAQPQVAQSKINRTWKSADGRELVGELVDYTATQIRVKRAGSPQPLVIPLTALSEADRKFVADLVNDRERDTSLTTGPYAESITGDFVPLKSKEGLPFQLYGSPKWDSKKRYPLVVLLHGTTQCGADNKAQMGLPTKTFGDLPHQKENPSFVLAPQCPDASVGWSGAVADNLMLLVNDLCAHLPIDRDRLYLVGAAMGGVGSYQLAIQHPDVWAALVPMSVSANISGAEALKDVAVWAFHGADDLAVSKGASVIKTITDAGNTRAKFSALKGEGKNVLPYVIIRDDMHKWLFEQRRGAAK